MKTLTLATLLATATPMLAQADSMTLNAPLSAGTLHSSDVDMSVYWNRSDTAIEVVAYYVARNALAEPKLLQLRLEDGEDVTFGLPGQPSATYTFARSDDALTVTTEPLEQKLVSN